MFEDLDSFFQPTAEEMAEVVSAIKLAPEECECYTEERFFLLEEEVGE